MTSNKRAKREARSRMKRTGESYSAARRATLAPDTASIPHGLAFIDDRCANCLGPIPDDEDGLFCSPWCRQTAKEVRYMRRVQRDGRIHDPDVRHAVWTRLAFLVNGGYDALGRNLSPQTRKTVKDRANGLCQQCGQPGIDVDHIAGSSPELENLQLLCKVCHNEKTAQSLVPAGPDVAALLRQLIADRVAPSTPRLLADDETTWEEIWKGLRMARRQRLLDEFQSVGLDPTGLTSRAEMVAALDDEYGDDVDWDVVGEEGSHDIDPETASSYDGGYGSDSYFSRAMNRDD